MKKPSASAAAASRPPLERMLRIHEELRGDNHPNCARLGQLLAVSPKTIQRDIAFMKDRLGLPVEYDESTRSFFYDGDVTSFPTVKVTEAEIFALIAARNALAPYRGTPFHAPMETAFAKLSAQLNQHVSFSLETLAAAISFHPSGLALPAPETFQSLAAAIVRREEISFQYRKLDADDTENRETRPYHLACVDNQWYLFAFDLKRQAMRTFVVARVGKITSLGRFFNALREFSMEKELRHSFGVMQSSTRHAVHLRFSSRAARQVAERTWHPREAKTLHPNGTLDYLLTVSDLGEIAKWVLIWAGDCEVIKPMPLRQLVRDFADMVAKTNS